MGSFEKTLLRFSPWLIERIPDDMIPDYGRIFGSKNRRRSENRRYEASRDLRHSGSGHSHSHSDDEDYDAQRRRHQHAARRSHSARRSSRHYDGRDDTLPSDHTRYQPRKNSMAGKGADNDRHRETGDASFHDGGVMREPPYPDTPAQRARPTNQAHFGAATGFATGAATSAAAVGASSRNDKLKPPSPSTNEPIPTNGPVTGYVPYSDIYGPPQGAPRVGPAPPTVQLGDSSYVGAQTNQQNNVAQDAPYGGHPGYMSDAHLQRDPRYFNDRYEDDHDIRRSDGRYDQWYDDRYDIGASAARRQDLRSDYDNNHSPERSPRRTHYVRNHSPSSESYYDDHGRRQSPTTARLQERVPAKQKSKPGIRDAFDTSEKSLGYSALGALAGGMLGSELGGPLPIALGAAAGALGTNAFRAREKKKEEARRNSAYQSGDPHDRRRDPRP